MRIVSRYWLGNLAAATGFVGLVVVRCLRWSVTVDDVGITRREPWATTFVPWTSLHTVEFRPPSLSEVYVGVRERWSDIWVEAEPYPRPNGRWVTVGFWASAVAVVLGGLVWDDARHDADVDAARDRRDRTHVKAWLRPPDERQVLLTLQRAGDLRDEYGTEDPLAIVYDSAHPRDADFADRPNRDANDDSVAMRGASGPLRYWIGVVGAVGSGIVIAVEWLRRRPATRRTSPTPR